MGSGLRTITYQIAQLAGFAGGGLVVAWIAVILLTFHWIRVVWSRTAVQLAAEAQRRQVVAERQKKGLLDGLDGDAGDSPS